MENTENKYVVKSQKCDNPLRILRGRYLEQYHFYIYFYTILVRRHSIHFIWHRPTRLSVVKLPPPLPQSHLGTRVPGEVTSLLTMRNVTFYLITSSPGSVERRHDAGNVTSPGTSWSPAFVSLCLLSCSLSGFHVLFTYSYILTYLPGTYLPAYRHTHIHRHTHTYIQESIHAYRQAD